MERPSKLAAENLYGENYLGDANCAVSALAD